MNKAEKETTIPEEFNVPFEESEKKPIKVLDEKVAVMGIEISRNKERGEHVPAPEKFANFSEDKFSLDLLQKIAKSVVLEQPLLLEGEAAVGKSYTIEYLAFLANQEVYRMSLNGQTDVTDLIGKWVPKTSGLRGSIEEILDNSLKCKTNEARTIIESKQVKTTAEAKKEAVEAGRGKAVYIGFSKEEMEEICRLEGIKVPEGDWVWQDGDIPCQMKAGAWSVLDEVNTCEPQILVRLNAVLERYGKMILHENGSKEVPRHSNFRLFATVNPPGGRYKGRMPLSTEWISRWNYQNIGGLPKEIRALRLMTAEGVAPQKVNLEELPFISPEKIEEEKKLVDFYGEEWTRDLFTKYAEFADKAIEMIRGGEIAKDQAQSFDFDQRDDLRFREYLRAFREQGKMKKTIQDALEYCFVNKLKDPRDRKKLKDVALGLIKVDEPKEILQRESKQKTKELTGLKARITTSGMSRKIIDKIFGGSRAKK